MGIFWRTHLPSPPKASHYKRQAAPRRPLGAGRNLKLGLRGLGDKENTLVMRLIHQVTLIYHHVYISFPSYLNRLVNAIAIGNCPIFSIVIIL